jgi:hypothetical protein
LGAQPQAALTVITYAGDRPVLQSTFTLFGRQRVVVVRDCLHSPNFALWQQRHHRAIAELGTQIEGALGAYLLRRLRPVTWALALYSLQRWGARWLQRQIWKFGGRFSLWVLAQTLRRANLL